MEDNASLPGQGQSEDPQQQLLELIEVRLEALRSITLIGADKYVPSGCWVREAHDAAQALGVPGRPVRPALDTWTFELEKAALDELRMWLESHLVNLPWVGPLPPSVWEKRFTKKTGKKRTAMLELIKRELIHRRVETTKSWLIRSDSVEKYFAP